MSARRRAFASTSRHVTSRLRICLPTQHTTHLLLPNSTQLNCAAAVYSVQRWRSARAKRSENKSLHPIPSPVPSSPTLICIDLIRAAHPSARPSARPRPTHETNASTSHARIRGGRNSDKYGYFSLALRATHDTRRSTSD